MRYTPEPLPVDVVPDLDPVLAGVLERLRAAEPFDAPGTVDAKARLLNAYLDRYGLTGVVVAISGGVDSAAVLGIVSTAARMPGSPIRVVAPFLLPVSDEAGATGQDDATRRGRAVCEAFGLTAHQVDLHDAHAALVAAVETGLGGPPAGTWERGQAVATTRTPALYLATSILTARGFPALICGTTNRTEGALGYVGRASDACVDVQLIGDLYKSEVYAVARHVGVPAEILDAVPTGDMFDSRTDEMLFGATYDFVELWLRLLLRDRASLGWPAATVGLYDRLAARVQGLVDYNAHKFLTPAQGVFLDVLTPRGGRSGWTYATWRADR